MVIGVEVGFEDSVAYAEGDGCGGADVEEGGDVDVGGGGDVGSGDGDSGYAEGGEDLVVEGDGRTRGRTKRRRKDVGSGGMGFGLARTSLERARER